MNLVLFGRERETAQLEKLLDQGRSGFGGSTLLLGEPGVGKTSLLHHAVDAGRDMNVSRAAGCETEVELPYSALTDLIIGLDTPLDVLTPGQAAVLRAVTGTGSPIDAGAFAVAASTYRLVVEAARRQPVLLAIDDGQWLDSCSLSTLLYVSRRACLAPVTVVIASRQVEATNPLRRAKLPELQVSGLSSRDAGLLLDSMHRQMAPAVRDQMVAGTGGNPLALIEVSASLDADQYAGTKPLPEPLPTGGSIERAYVALVASLPPDVQRVLLVAAVADTGDLREILAAADVLGAEASSIGIAECGGLVTIDENSVRFRHPLLRSAIYYSAATVTRRAVHRALAVAVDGPFADDRRAWHAAAGADERDEAIAWALEDTALRVRQRAGYGAAANTFAKSADLTPTAERRAGRLLQAALDAQVAGRDDDAERSIDMALGLTIDPIMRADLQRARGRSLVWRAPLDETFQLLMSEAARVEPADAGRSALLLADAALTRFPAGETDAAINVARQAHTIGQRVGPPVEHTTGLVLASALLFVGEDVLARALLEPWCQDLDRTGRLMPLDERATAAAAFDLLGEFETARRMLDDLAGLAREYGGLGALPIVLAQRSDVHFRTGDWQAAETDANEGVSIGLDIGQGAVLSYCWFQLIQLDAARGNMDDCLERSAHVFEMVAELGAHSLTIMVDAALGHLHLGRGELEPAINHLERAENLFAAGGGQDTTILGSTPNLIEAYVRTGRLAAAHELLERFEQAGARSQRPWTLACIDRCRGLVDAVSFEQRFQAALARHHALASPFDRARTEMCYGERLRRAGHRNEARKWLRSALTAYESLGARSWAEHTLRELRATGEHRASRVRWDSTELTGQELQVARLVAAGHTNREVAAALFLSTKTVEHHLTNAYRKAGVRSRTQLARIVSQKLLDPA